MAGIFKRKYRVNGKKREYRSWTIELRLPDGRFRRIRGFRDKAATQEFARKCERLIATRANGQPLDPELREWVGKIHLERKQKLAKLGLLDASITGASRSLLDHLQDYRRDLESPERENSRDYVVVTHSRCKAILEGIRATKVSDLTLGSVSDFLKAKRLGGLSVKSSNHYAASIRGFTKWLTRRLRLPENPLEGLSALRVKQTDRRRIRRALDVSELIALLSVTQDGPVRHGVQGQERAALYRLAAETGLRSREIRSLTAGDFELGAAPSVRLRAEFAKNGKSATIALRDELADELRKLLTNKLPSASAFRMPHENVVSTMLQKDLLAANVPYADDQGRIADFHALRTTFATHLLASGTDLRTAQEMMRHSTAALTSEVYGRVLPQSSRDALKRLPSFRPPAASAQKQVVSAGGKIDRRIDRRHVPNYAAGSTEKVASANSSFGQSAKIPRKSAVQRGTRLQSGASRNAEDNGSGWESNPPSPTGVRLQRF